MSDLFLSYATIDKPRVSKLARSLVDLGYLVWWDVEIEPGKRFERVISEALENSKAVVVVWTFASIISEWVYEEADYGKRKNILIPVFLDDCLPPLGFRTREGARLVNWPEANTDKEWEKLLISIEPLVGPAPARKKGLHHATDVGRFVSSDSLKSFTSTKSLGGLDLRCDVSISLEEAFFGRQVDVVVKFNDQQRTLHCKIPKGIEDGTRIRLAEEGDTSPDGRQKGDLYLVVSIAAHPLFEREEADLHTRIPIRITTAILGGMVRAPSPDGEVVLDIAAGTQSGQRFVAHGKGMTKLRSEERGDLVVECVVETPTNLSPEATSLLTRLDKFI